MGRKSCLATLYSLSVKITDDPSNAVMATDGEASVDDDVKKVDIKRVVDYDFLSPCGVAIK